MLIISLSSKVHAISISWKIVFTETYMSVKSNDDQRSNIFPPLHYRVFKLDRSETKHLLGHQKCTSMSEAVEDRDVIFNQIHVS